MEGNLLISIGIVFHDLVPAYLTANLLTHAQTNDVNCSVKISSSFKRPNLMKRGSDGEKESLKVIALITFFCWIKTGFIKHLDATPQTAMP